MRAYVIRRLLLLVPTLFLVTVAVFLTVRFIPGTVIDLMIAQMSQSAGGQQVNVDSIRESMGLDVPMVTQYGRWMGIAPNKEGRRSGILEGNLGKSLWTGRSINEDMLDKVPVSIELGLIGMVTALVFALPIGVYSAMRQDTIGDYSGRTVSVLAISLPNFWVGTLVVVFASIWWSWSPSMKLIPFFKDPAGNLIQFVIPGVILGMTMSGASMRMVRTMMLEVLRQDYIRTAWAKGLSERAVVLRHALKNALMPVVTIVGFEVPILIGGEVVIETIFNLPGIGRYLVDSINRRDYTIISSVNLIIASIVLLLNLAIDLTYAWLDPRIQYS
jgi:peptide/nickel transport system permease protein